MTQESRRVEFIRAATGLFADRGFYGTSIAAVAAELGLTKQALLHHFPTKDKLYGAVFEEISDRVMMTLAVGQDDDMTAEDRLEVFFVRFCETALQDNTDVRLILRELLDNRHRADTAGRWYLKPFLQELAAMVQDTNAWQGASRDSALVAAYHLLGSISYFAVSEVTLAGIFGEETAQELETRFTQHIRESLRNLVAV